MFNKPPAASNKPDQGCGNSLDRFMKEVYEKYNNKNIEQLWSDSSSSSDDDDSFDPFFVTTHFFLIQGKGQGQGKDIDDDHLLLQHSNPNLDTTTTTTATTSSIDHNKFGEDDKKAEPCGFEQSNVIGLAQRQDQSEYDNEQEADEAVVLELKKKGSSTLIHQYSNPPPPQVRRRTSLRIMEKKKKKNSLNPKHNNNNINNPRRSLRLRIQEKMLAPTSNTTCKKNRTRRTI